MKLLSPTQHRRLNEIIGFLLLSLGLVLLLSLVSYHTQDPSLDTAASSRPLNLVGYPALTSRISSFRRSAPRLLFRCSAFCFPGSGFAAKELEAGGVKICGSILLTLALSAAFSFVPLRVRRHDPDRRHARPRAGQLLVDLLNVTGALLITLTAVVISLYFVSTFTLAKLGEWLAGPLAWMERRADAWREWRDRMHQQSIEKAKAKAAARRIPREKKATKTETLSITPLHSDVSGRAPWETNDEPQPAEYASVEEPSPRPVAYAAVEEIPICPVEDLAPVPDPFPALTAATAKENARNAPPRIDPVFRLPPTDLLNWPPPRNPFDEQELKETASAIKAKFEEFNVMGNVVQINPGPVVTTFEFKPDAGVKYSRITNLVEDLCLGLQAESILIERIPGKPTVGIEVPNTKRELIALRQLLESDEFQNRNRT